ncbi:MAG: hypothetical protein LBI29_02800 [Rickettsiales bacterium]|jgi:citrate synthase|nr:hypothetical protein [Rickettsiales bacterium]
MSDEVAILDKRSGNNYSFGFVRAKKGPSAVDFEDFYEKTGFFIYDPSLRSVALCKSNITFIDAANSKLYYRGYDLEEIIIERDYLEVVALMLEGKFLENRERLELETRISPNVEIYDIIVREANSLCKKFSPLELLRVLLMLILGHSSCNNPYEFISSIPIIIAVINQSLSSKTIGIEDIVRDGYIKSFLSMFFAEKTVDSRVVNLIEKFLIIHMDHEQNASTTSVRILTSVDSDLVNIILGGILALEGKRHGGAGVELISLLERTSSPSDVRNIINSVKEKGFKIPGVGHRVYTISDPRANIMKKIIDKDALVLRDSLFDKLRELEKYVLNDDYFLERKLCPNIDFYSGIILHSLGIKKEMFLMFFILARSVGWLAHVKELMNNKNNIIRPRQIFT